MNAVWTVLDQITGPVLALCALVGIYLQWRSIRRLHARVKRSEEALEQTRTTSS